MEAYTKEKFLKFELALYSNVEKMLQLPRAVSDLVNLSYHASFSTLV